ncbi:Thiosulfate:glutathione sulfurtransferase [Coelomomyces lativittatus]|nr:Thiosulfate:glutathione sulfurtransferase [Coelomomyces lativittatus]KAJ1506980.1 Thiosulfate:glutathione sulfurtransferase [Coelomomyces lativittatus]KAJ1511179.1 Thiosulfate:glutathione sulfurtransferase [Coelomomyces lativittatus]
MSFAQLKGCFSLHWRKKWLLTTSPFLLPSTHSIPPRYLATLQVFSSPVKKLPIHPPSRPSSSTCFLQLSSRSMTIAKTPQPDENKFLSSQDVTPEELLSMIKDNRTAMDKGDILLIDVRNPEETSLGTIPTAISVPLSELKDALVLPNMQFKLMYQGEKPSRETGNLIFYCKSGKRSSSACEIAKSLGFKKVRNFPGSYEAWLAFQEHLSKSEFSSSPSN